MRNLLAAATVAALSTVGAASAAVIDFTANSTPNSGTIAGGVSYALTTAPTAPVRNTGDAPGPIGALLGQNDGVGVGAGNDEISFPGESATLTFSSAVTISALYFLDLFRNPTGSPDAEVVSVTADGGTASMFVAQEDFPGTGYGAFTGLSLTGTVFVFAPMQTNDGVGRPDFALGGLDVAPVPLPAGVLLLGTALAGFGMARRRARA